MVVSLPFYSNSQHWTSLLVLGLNSVLGKYRLCVSSMPQFTVFKLINKDMIHNCVQTWIRVFTQSYVDEAYTQRKTFEEVG